MIYKIIPSLEPLRELRLQSNQANNSTRDGTLQKEMERRTPSPLAEHGERSGRHLSGHKEVT